MGLYLSFCPLLKPLALTIEALDFWCPEAQLDGGLPFAAQAGTQKLVRLTLLCI